ncbi:uncharacterized protein EV420DRAFT_739665 [Desarmillaria tabescens]|uniref:Uncharacterized protein n=1 Tax=Armillaria tabescens TaxID=1929756 RepID=A0AA39MXG5_ARMTA|nr:uncharacterized protein EV420DRAFT_739665 [Desarmillaria tabescens]KAK0450556.1 hypothetical protein EV420DRAFT_739665 [Desarmillaria tabescens]
MEEPLKDTERLAGLLEACGDYTGPKNGSSSENPSYGASIPELMEGLSLAESSLAHTLVAFMERVVGLIFVRRHPLARVLESVQTAAYNFLASLYHLLDEAIWLLRSAADSVQLGPGEVPFQALHVSMFDRFKSFRDRCKFVRSSLPGIDAAFDSGQTDLVEELKAVGLHYISRILLPLPGGMGAHAALIDDLPAVFSVLKRSARDVVDGINAFEQRILRFRDCFVDLAWVETMVGNPVLVKGMLDVLLSISHEQSRLRESLSDISLAPVGVTTENVLFNL